MAKNLPPECHHIIKENYYCENCGTLCYNNVSNNKFISLIILFYYEK